GFFETMRIPVLAGRAFVPRDMGTDNAMALIVNEAFARRYFGRGPAVGRTFEGRFGAEDDSAGQYEVVGVVADARYDLRKPAAPTIYIPLRLRSNGTIHVRVASESAALTSRLREEIAVVNQMFRVTSVRSQSAAVNQTLLRE